MIVTTIVMFNSLERSPGSW